MRIEKVVFWVGGILAVGLGAWLVSMFPCFAAALAGSLVTHLVMYSKDCPKKIPTPSFWVAWFGGVLAASLISWMNSLVPPIGCITSAFFGGVVMLIAAQFKEEVEATEEEGTGPIITPVPEPRVLLTDPFRGIIPSPPPPSVFANMACSGSGLESPMKPWSNRG